MSGALKSGLIFGLVGFVVVIGFSFIPLVGPILCGPLAAGIVGTAAGYYGVRWSTSNTGIGRGVLAGGLAGIGSLIGAVTFFVVAFTLVRSNPIFQEQLDEALRQQQNAQIDKEQLDILLGVLGPIAGLCSGVFNLILSLAFGGLGGWLLTRKRDGSSLQQPPMQPPTQPPPLAPND